MRLSTVLLQVITVCAAMLWLKTSVGFGQSPRPLGRAPEPKEESLTTKDGVRLGVTYFASNMGREAVPIVFLHQHKESRMVFNALARALQSPTDPRLDSHAVVTVDLRGHGTSTTVQYPGGEVHTIDSASLRPNDYSDMVEFDMEAVRKFLVEKNDVGELNLNKLCLIGTGMGANVAITWAAVDWDAPPLARRKQGQDVKALVMISPIWKQPGIPLVNALRQPDVQGTISVMLAYGSQETRATRDAKTIHKIFARFHPEPPIDQVRELKDLFEYSLPTTLQGSALLLDPRFQMLANLDNFIKARLTDKKYPWIGRKIDQ